MTLEEIEKSLPNGLHDAKVSNLNIDYVKRVVKFKLDIWTGDLSSKKTEVREAYGKACLTLSNFLYCVIEPPDPSYPYIDPKPLCVGTGSIQTDIIPAAKILPENLPDGAFSHWFFVNNWNAFIFVAATNAQLEWKN